MLVQIRSGYASLREVCLQILSWAKALCRVSVLELRKTLHGFGKPPSKCCFALSL